MAKIDVNTQVEGPDLISIKLVRADYLETSNTFRIMFEVCLAFLGALLGAIIELVSDKKEVPVLDWVFLSFLFLGCAVLLYFTHQNYEKAKSQTPGSQTTPTTASTAGAHRNSIID
jgi:hypothetical protein